MSPYEQRVHDLLVSNNKLLFRAREAEDILKSFVTETRAYSSPECEECGIIGPLLREADEYFLKLEGKKP